MKCVYVLPKALVSQHCNEKKEIASHLCIQLPFASWVVRLLQLLPRVHSSCKPCPVIYNISQFEVKKKGAVPQQYIQLSFVSWINIILNFIPQAHRNYSISTESWAHWASNRKHTKYVGDLLEGQPLGIYFFKIPRFDLYSINSSSFGLWSLEIIYKMS